MPTATTKAWVACVPIPVMGTRNSRRRAFAKADVLRLLAKPQSAVPKQLFGQQPRVGAELEGALQAPNQQPPFLKTHLVAEERQGPLIWAAILRDRLSSRLPLALPQARLRRRNLGALDYGRNSVLVSRGCLRPLEVPSLQWIRTHCCLPPLAAGPPRHPFLGLETMMAPSAV